MRLLLAALVLAAFAPAAHAQWEPSGAITGLLAIEPTADERRLGGDLVVDLFERVGPATFGLGIGVGASTSDNDDVNRVFAPLTLTAGIGLRPRPVGFHVFLRGGFWAGATNDGLRVGGLAGFGARLEVRLDDALAIGATFETWRLAGELERWMILPGLSLVWRPFDPPTEPIEPEPPLEVEPLD
ncbi:MAG: hypothetical protein H6721_04520 [Sandaracinus sp.]|nr:hypothetical protein [Myxococcales bacterium]MCB9602899.1 hypothetical protein [Sandaracinus sp.]MCB9631390.1 hypothetical protein [Sandaracinus sp.]